MPSYGPRLSSQDYSHRTRALLNPEDYNNPDPGFQKNLRRQEFELTVDHRLGQNFPAEKRDPLFLAVEKARAPWRLGLGLVGIAFAKLFHKPARNAVSSVHLDFLASGMTRAVSKVLTREEALQFLGDKQV
jgi:hypothetical protein